MTNTNLGKYLILRGRDCNAEALAPAVKIYDTYAEADSEARKKVTRQNSVFVCKIMGVATVEETTFVETE